MKLIYNIDFEVVGVIYIFVIYAALCIFYSDQSEVNKKFKLLVKCTLAAEIMDIVTAVTISYGSMVSSELNILINTVYFVLTFSLGYALLRYVESYVGYRVHRLKNIYVNKIIYLSILFVLFLNMFTGFLFSFNGEGEYIHGGLYLFVYFVPIYYVVFSASVLVKNHGFFKLKQKLSISVYITTCVLGPVLQMLLFPAMIIGIADAYDAMASRRSYRDVLPQQVVREEIEKGRGTQFHPVCTDIMLQMIDGDKDYQMCEH